MNCKEIGIEKNEFLKSLEVVVSSYETNPEMFEKSIEKWSSIGDKTTISSESKEFVSTEDLVFITSELIEQSTVILMTRMSRLAQKLILASSCQPLLMVIALSLNTALYLYATSAINEFKEEAINSFLVSEPSHLRSFVNRIGEMEISFLGLSALSRLVIGTDIALNVA